MNVSMMKLREARKQYVRAPGTKSMVNGDNLALALATLTPVQIAIVLQQVLALDVNPYAHLNPGQQSMNMRNKLRAAIIRGEVTLDEIIAVRDSIIAAVN